MKACTQCGKCCTNEMYMNTLEIDGVDVKRWRRQGRDDILAHIEVIGRTKADPWADAWFTKAGNSVKGCPFVRKIRGADRYTCTIYDTRPQVCRSYPHSVDQMAAAGCEMLEPGDTDADVDRFMGRPPTIAND